ncbi:pro-neuregulin-2, membrane-bound isoform-like, partial [Osmerus mordax]|uniref:pro-neuregulin-2, membrane-bound isoform-like n=1 Tax=Osmerus mordax TaxID=8014 RepID=UPI0035107305
MSEEKKKQRKGKNKGERKRGKKEEIDPTKAAAPKLRRMRNPLTVNEGSRLTVKCEATGNPGPTYRWFKDGNELKKSREIRIKTSQKNSKVQISRARLEDSGNYTCVAENPLGKDNSTSAVHVQ